MHPRRAPWLEAALLFTIVIHAVAMVSMSLLLPGLPGGLNEHVADRAAHIAAHPWLWRIGWFPWQVTAASDVILGIALVCTRWIPKWPAVISALITFAAVIPDQYAQFSWTVHGPAIAKAAVESGDLAAYAAYETRTFTLTAGWGAMGYTLGAIGWSISFAAAGAWFRWLTWASVVVWSVFAAATAVLFMPESVRTLPAASAAVSIGNALAFVLLMAWLLGVYEAVLRRGQPMTSLGGHARWTHPSRGPTARIAELIANSRAARRIGSFFPGAAMSSDITNVVYVNYLVDAQKLEPYVDAPLKLQRLGPGGRYAMFTFLTYRHGHFGPTCFGPLRRLWPSPIQSNWRIYVTNPATGRSGVQFLTTAITSTPHALATRILAEGVPMHIPASASLTREDGGIIRLSMKPGSGTAPDVEGVFHVSDRPTLPSPWNECFGTWEEMLAYCVPQDRALSSQPWNGRVTRQEITLHIPLDRCTPLEGTISSAAVEMLVGDATSSPLCFIVDKVGFSFDDEVADT